MISLQASHIDIVMKLLLLFICKNVINFAVSIIIVYLNDLGLHSFTMILSYIINNDKYNKLLEIMMK